MNGLTAHGSPPELPVFLSFVRLGIILLSVVVLALAIYVISIYQSYTGYASGYSGPAGLLIFAVVKTWIFYIFLMVLAARLHQLYSRIVAIVLYAVSVVVWLAAWAWSAAAASVWLNYYCSYGVCSSPGTFAQKEGRLLAVCAGLGAVIWVLSITNLVVFIRACLANRSSYSQPELDQLSASGKGYAYPAPNPSAPAAPYQSQP